MAKKIIPLLKTFELTCLNHNVSQEEEFRRFASRTDVYEAICSKVAPSIFGEENVKKAVACLLFGGSRKVCLALFVVIHACALFQCCDQSL